MRVLYLDIDSLRPDHLGCYGYHRNTSPNIDRIAAQGVRFENCYVTDAPCLPSRTALFSGRFGVHTGVINHGGTAADPLVEGPGRGFRSTLGQTAWPSTFRQLGYRTATVSPFGERHSAWHWYAGFNEVYNTGKGGGETADEVSPVAIDWLRRNARAEDWFLHVNLWDPHTPYRTPEGFPNPFANDALPAWLTEEVRQAHWAGCGPHSAREVLGFGGSGEHERRIACECPQQPVEIGSMEDVRRMFDGYDRAVRFADEHISRMFNTLADLGVLDDTMIVISSDHGENLGELNIYGDHQLADHVTRRVPLIIRPPGVTDGQAGRVDAALHYHLDFAATVTELVGGKVPAIWDGRSFAGALRDGQESGREFLVLSQGAWSCQRSVRFEDFICIRSYHDGLHGFPDVMLFDVRNDPHEQHDLAPRKPELVARAMTLLDQWHGEAMRTATHAVDPMWTVLREGGPLHCRGALTNYARRLRETGRAAWADRLERRHGLAK